MNFKNSNIEVKNTTVAFRFKNSLESEALDCKRCFHNSLISNEHSSSNELNTLEKAYLKSSIQNFRLKHPLNNLDYNSLQRA